MSIFHFPYFTVSPLRAEPPIDLPLHLLKYLAHTSGLYAHHYAYHCISLCELFSLALLCRDLGQNDTRPSEKREVVIARLCLHNAGTFL